MKYVGFFRELNPACSALYCHSIRDLMTRGEYYSVSGVVEYLHSGHGVLDLMGVTRDVVGGKFEVPGGASVATDGEYVWRDDLVAYVHVYCIDLPPDLLMKIKKSKFTVPHVPRARLMEISRQVARELGYRKDSGAGSGGK